MATMKEVEERSTDRSVQRKAYHHVSMKKDGRCTFCPPHGGENEGRTPRRSWKNRRKLKWRNISGL